MDNEKYLDKIFDYFDIKTYNDESKNYYISHEEVICFLYENGYINDYLRNIMYKAYLENDFENHLNEYIRVLAFTKKLIVLLSVNEDLFNAIKKRHLDIPDHINATINYVENEDYMRYEICFYHKWIMINYDKRIDMVVKRKPKEFDTTEKKQINLNYYEVEILLNFVEILKKKALLHR